MKERCHAEPDMQVKLALLYSRKHRKQVLVLVICCKQQYSFHMTDNEVSHMGLGPCSPI